MFREGLILLKKLPNHDYDNIADIADIVISMRYVVGLSEFYYQKFESQDLYPVQSPDLNQNLISSSSCIRGIFCVRKLKYVYRS